MRIEQLLYLSKTSKIGSINKTAEKLHISQQSLNTTLKNLEKELGYPLLTTSRQGVSLTPQGEIVLQTAEKILPLIDQMKDALKQSTISTNRNETISVQAASVTLEFLFPNILQNIYDNFPHLSVNLTEGDHFQTIDALEQKQIDLGLLGIQYTLWEKLSLTHLLSSSLTFEPLYQYKLSLVVNEQHPLAEYKSISMRTIIKHPIVLYTHSPIEKNLQYLWLKLYGEPNIKFTTPSIQIYMDILKSGKAIGFLPNTRHCGFNFPLQKGIKLISLKDNDSISTVGYLYNNTQPITPAMQTVIDELITFCH